MKNLVLSIAALLIVLSGCMKTDSTAIDNLFSSYNEFKLRINPIEATKGGDYRFNHVLANYISDAHQEDLIENYSKYLKEITDIDKSILSESELLSLRVMQWDCEINLQGLQNELAIMASPMFNIASFKLMPLNQITSLNLYFSQIGSGTSIQPFKTVKDYENWLLRMADYVSFIETAIANMKEGIAIGVVLPKAVVKKMIAQVEGMANKPAEEQLYYKPIKIMPADFSKQDSTRLALSYYEFIAGKMIPTHKSLARFLSTTYLESSRETSGIGSLPAGPKTYQYLIKYNTTTNMSPDEIHNLGLREVDRILMEMEKVKNKVGFKGDLKAFLDDVRTSEKQMPYTKPQEVIAHFESIHEKMKDQLNKIFGITPKADFIIKRTEAFREASASAEYYPGTKDGSRPGTFYVPIPDVLAYNKFSDEALFLHEAIPGHHYQLSLQQENKNLPEFLHPESMVVFVEGWALYAESLGSELGLYTDPYQYFGMLSMEMHRAIRLVVDTGLHAKGWTREQAIQYSLDHEADTEASIISEIERYMATPGQALAYKIGQLKIRELRTKAENSLAEKFDIREFHNQVLNSGSLPLVLLEEKIDTWIENTM